MPGDRPHLALLVGRYYYQQAPALLRWALTRDLQRVTYSELEPRKPDFDLVRDLMLRHGLLEEPIEFEEYVDPRFAKGAMGATAWRYEAGDRVAE